MEATPAHTQSEVGIKKNRIQVEPTDRWIRVQFNNCFVADSREALLVREGHRLAYYFPIKDVAMDCLTISHQDDKGHQYYDLMVGDRSADSAARINLERNGYSPDLISHIAFSWSKMDHWFEEEEEVFVHPRDPYHRVDAIHSSRKMRIEIDGTVVANSLRPVVVFETGLPTRYYLPVEDVNMELLNPSQARTSCPYKGDASYWHAEISGTEYRNIVWAYMEPIDEITKISGMLCFFNEKVDLFVDGVLQERPETFWS